MQRIQFTMTVLVFGLLISSCGSSSIKKDGQKEPTKGQLISGCMDKHSPEQCDKKYNR